MNKVILFAEDNDDHYLLNQEAYQEAKLAYPIKRVRDGEELMDYLLKQGPYAKDNTEAALILLDLNMPKKDGREALQEIKLNPKLKSIPVIILTTSKNDEDVSFADRLGVIDFIRKPSGFNELVEFMKSLANILPSS